MSPEFKPVFQRLSKILRDHAGKLTIKDDTPTRFCLAGGVHPKHKTPIPVAWVEIGKSYVSFHLMPVYAYPKLLEGISAKLKARMQGKACFHFKVKDESLFEELEELTVAGFAAFRKAGYMP
jgi:hypothetical protein